MRCLIVAVALLAQMLVGHDSAGDHVVPGAAEPGVSATVELADTPHPLDAHHQADQECPGIALAGTAGTGSSEAAWTSTGPATDTAKLRAFAQQDTTHGKPSDARTALCVTRT